MSKLLLPPIFLVGCPRSGTTLLQSLLGTHPLIYSFPETKFFQFALPEDRKEIIRKILGLISSNLPPRLRNFFEYNLERPELLDNFPRIPLVFLYTKHFLKILDQLTLEKDKQVWLEKTPEHIFKISYIQNYLPSARFIHLVRQPKDVIASLYEITRKYPEWWGGTWDLEYCIKRWQDSVEISCKYLDHPQHLLVKYEDLVREPTICLENICDFLQLGFTEKMLENYGEIADYLTGKSSRNVNKLGIVCNGSSKYQNIFSEEEKMFIEKKLSTMENLLILIGMKILED